MGLWIARIVPPIALAVAIVAFDYLRHIWWPDPWHAWPAILLAMLAVGAGAYLLVELLVQLLTRRYSRSMRVAEAIASLPSALERMGEDTQSQGRMAAKGELLRQLASLMGASGAAFFAGGGEGGAILDTAYGVPNGALPRSIPWDGNGVGGDQAPRPAIAMTALQYALGESGYSSLDVLPLRSGGQAVGYLVLYGNQKLQEWLNWREARALVTALVGGALRNLQLTSESQVIATLRERDRIAKELHDSLAQTLTSIHLEAKAALAAPGPEVSGAARERLKAIAATAREGVGEIRTAILDLRGGRTKGRDLLGLLERYVQRFAQDTGLSAEVQVEPGAVTKFPSLIEIQLLRVVQEALTNVRKHAAGAKHVRVVFCNKPGAACVCIQDDGVGFSVAPVLQRGGGFGLVSMRERLQDLGGDLDIKSDPGLGTHIQAKVPLEPSFARGV